MFKLILILAAWVLPAASFAEIYKWTDSSGSVHFSDRANSNAKKVDVKPNRPLTPVRKTAKQRTNVNTVTRTTGKAGVTRIISQSKQE